MVICGTKDHEDGSSFFKNFLVRFWVHWCFKAIGTMAFTALFFFFYFYLLSNPLFSPIQMPLTLWDNFVGFTPEFLYFYLSLWVYVSLVPALMKSKRELIRYGIYVGLLCLIGISIYTFFPTVVPPSDVDWNRYPDFSFLKSMDAAGNAFPSMHVATALFSYLWFNHNLRQMNAPRWVMILNFLWCVGIVYSTMATKQHVFLDVIGGVALGGIFGLWSLRDHAARFRG
jgi:membrane-associated phospholipid phosphatase